MKYILILAFVILSLHAQIDKKEMYAKVKSQSADLYAKPYQCAKKKVAYFSKGDMIEISYCDRYKWCKTKNGFVKKNLLRLPEPLAKQDKKMPEKIEVITPPLVAEVETNATTEVIDELVDVTIVENIGAYEEYFSGDSVKVIFKEKK